MRKFLAIICILLSVATILSLASCAGDKSTDSDDKKTEKAEKLPGGKRTKLGKLAYEEFEDEEIFFAYPEGFTKNVDEYENCIWFEGTNGSFVRYEAVPADRGEHFLDPAILLSDKENIHSDFGPVTEKASGVYKNGNGVSATYASYYFLNDADNYYLFSAIAVKNEDTVHLFYVVNAEDDLTYAEIVYLSLEFPAKEEEDGPSADTNIPNSAKFEDEFVTFSYPEDWVIEENGYSDDLPAFSICDPNSYDKISVRYTLDDLMHPQDMLEYNIDNYYYDDTVTDTITDVKANGNGVTIYRMAFTYDSEYGDPGRVTVLQFAVADSNHIGYIEIYDGDSLTSPAADYVYKSLNVNGKAADLRPVPAGFIWYENNDITFLRPALWSQSGYDTILFIAPDRTNISVTKMTKSQIGTFFDLSGDNFKSLMYQSMLQQNMAMQTVTAHHGSTGNGINYSAYEFYAKQNGATVYEYLFFFRSDDNGYMLTYAGLQPDYDLIDKITSSVEIVK